MQALTRKSIRYHWGNDAFRLLGLPQTRYKDPHVFGAIFERF